MEELDYMVLGVKLKFPVVDELLAVLGFTSVYGLEFYGLYRFVSHIIKTIIISESSRMFEC